MKKTDRRLQRTENMEPRRTDAEVLEEVVEEEDEIEQQFETSELDQQDRTIRAMIAVS